MTKVIKISKFCQTEGTSLQLDSSAKLNQLGQGSERQFEATSTSLSADGGNCEPPVSVLISALEALQGNLGSTNTPDTSNNRISRKVRSMGKRILDLVISALGLVLLSPLFLVCAVLTKLDSEEPVFYKQERIGLNRRRSDRRSSGLDVAYNRRASRNRRREDYYGKPFTVYKFRTMVKDAKKMCGAKYNTQNDRLITRFGRLLRKTRLSELPQLWNVLKGNMSLVGPRPERAYLVREFASQVSNYTKRLLVKPGITGLAQVEIGYGFCEEDINQKINYDLYYANYWSLWKDIKILFKALGLMANGRAAF